MYLGFCGSLTTFSGWQLDVFNSWINEGHSHRNGLRDVCLHLFVQCLGSSCFEPGSRRDRKNIFYIVDILGISISWDPHRYDAPTRHPEAATAIPCDAIRRLDHLRTGVRCDLPGILLYVPLLPPSSDRRATFQLSRHPHALRAVHPSEPTV